MKGFSERFSGIYAKQEEIDARKREEDAAPLEAVRLETSITKLDGEIEELETEYNASKDEAEEARKAIFDANKLLAERSVSIDVEAELGAMKLEAMVIVKKSDELGKRISELKRQKSILESNP